MEHIPYSNVHDLFHLAAYILLQYNDRKFIYVRNFNTNAEIYPT